ncbi:hypothetical protein [Paenibacillus sp. GYB003]|uniref:hypothetical protein n=1 Tax=Paenibacillus sp. GYB003 TaxID=2994392 RepID=UPI002F96C23F
MNLSEKDQQFFHSNKGALLSFTDWKNLNKDLRRELLKFWRTITSDHTIRETWGVTVGNFYYHLKALGLAGSREIHSEQRPEQSRKRITPDLEVIDAEYQVIEDSSAVVAQRETSLATTQMATTISDKSSFPIMRFNESGTPDRIMKRLRAIIGNLELEEQELELRIEIYRKE